MKQSQLSENKSHFTFPMIGQRIVKTSVAVFLCLLFYWLRGYRGQDMPTEAAITAIICMQPYVRDTRDYAVNRFTGSLIGSLWGLLFTLLVLLVPALGRQMLALYAVMALGVTAALYTAVIIRKPDAAALAAIVYLCIVVSFPEIDDPLRQAANRMLGVLVGTVAAVGVNLFRLPRSKNRDCVFFVRMKDLAPDRFTPIPSAARFRLHYLLQDGAKICLMSEHAPAFFSLQMGDTPPGLPLIVMDGAAIYDANENRYLAVEKLGERAAARLTAWLDRRPVSYFLYTIHKDRTCVFHRGELRAPEARVLSRMRRSPYRSYLDGDSPAPEELVYVKIIADAAETEALRRSLQGLLHANHLRAAVHPEAGETGVSALYIYSAKATMRQAENRLMALLREKDPALRQTEVFLRGEYRSEYDAMSLLHALGNLYEPLRLFPRRDKQS